ncbi:MAG: hypothetical protein ACKVPY_00625 [Paracoccaceae bacterium]
MTALTFPLSRALAAPPHAGTGPGPGPLARFLDRRRAARALALGTERLARTSPHLLADIGLTPYLPDAPAPAFAGRP